MNRRILVLVTAVTVVVIGGVIALVLSTVRDTADREFVIVIPDGTGDKIAAGEDPGVIPPEIELTLGEKDILVIQNNDIVGHTISDFWVGAGETLRQEFKSPAVYQGICTLHESAQIQIIVKER